MSAILNCTYCCHSNHEYPQINQGWNLKDYNFNINKSHIWHLLRLLVYKENYIICACMLMSADTGLSYTSGHWFSKASEAFI